MKNILILGAGRSSSSLIQYLLETAHTHQWHVRVGDADLGTAVEKTQNHPNSTSFKFDASDPGILQHEIESSDLVISMLPASMHPEVAKHCVQLKKHLVTPSYVSPAMMELNAGAKANDVILLNEMGVDPGIDHMSAMKIIHEIQVNGGELLSFESFTGGLVAPESDNNPWHYKITWNPRNVVLAGAGGPARYLENGKIRFIPYHRLFERTIKVHIDGYGDFEGYANRDSLSYRQVYGIEQVPTIYRGTLRKAGFCSAWNMLIQLGITDDTVKIEKPAQMKWKDLTLAFLPVREGMSAEQNFEVEFHPDADAMSRLRWLGIFSNEPLEITEGTPAQALQKLIEKRWKLEDGDKDMIVMWHRFTYRKNGSTKEIQSAMVCKGEDPIYTAMAKTVGLPIAIAAKMIMLGKIELRGVQLPIVPSLYNPILDELKEFGITFTENQKTLS